MPALVPIVAPSQVVDAVSGEFFDNRKTICVANSHQLTFYHPNFVPCSLAVPTANAITSIGVLRIGSRDSLVVCVPDHKRRKSLVCVASCTPNQISIDQSFEYDLLDQQLKFLCTNESRSVAVVRLLPGQLLVLQARKTKVVARVHSGTWGRIRDACFDAHGDLVLLENLPSMSPSVTFNTFGDSGIVQNRMIVPVDLQDCAPKLFRWGDCVLVAGKESIQKICDNNVSTLCKVGASFFALHNNNNLVIGSVSGAIFLFNRQNSTLKKIFSARISNMLCEGDRAFVWGPCMTCILEMPSGELSRNWPTVAAVEQIRPFKSPTSSGALLSTPTGTFTFEYSASASLAAQVSLKGICRLIRLKDLLVSTPEETLVFNVNEQGISQADAYLFYDLEQETIAANDTFQVTPLGIKTSSSSTSVPVELAAVTDKQAAVLSKGSILLYNSDLKLELSFQLDGPVVLVYAWGKPCVAGAFGIHHDGTTLQIHGVCDMIQFNEFLVVGTKQGLLQFYTSDWKLAKEVSLQHDPVTFCIHNQSLIAASNKVLVFDCSLNCSRLVLGHAVSMMASLSDSVLCGVQVNQLSIFYTQNSFKPELRPLAESSSAIAVAGDGFRVVTSTPDKTELLKYSWDNTILSSLALDVAYDESCPMQLFAFSGGCVLISGGLSRTSTITVVCGDSQSSFDTNIMAPMYASIISDGVFTIAQENRKGLLKVSPTGINLEYTGMFRALIKGVDFKDSKCVYSVHYIDAIMDSKDEQIVLAGTADASCAVLFGSGHLIYANNKLISSHAAYEFDDPVFCMAREGPNGVILGTANGGVYMYIELDPSLEQELLKLWSVFEQAPRSLFQAETELVRWNELLALPQDKITDLCVQAAVDRQVFDQIQQAICSYTL